MTKWASVGLLLAVFGSIAYVASRWLSKQELPEPRSVASVVRNAEPTETVAGGDRDVDQHVRDAARSSTPTLREQVERMLFLDEPEAYAGEHEISNLIGSGAVTRDEAAAATIEELSSDSAGSQQRLANPEIVARFLVRDARPGADVMKRAMAYKAASPRGRHIRLHELLRGWPCGDERSCAESALSELNAVIGSEEFPGLVADYWRRGGVHSAAVKELVVGLTFGLERDVRTITVVLTVIADNSSGSEAAAAFAEMAKSNADRFYSTLSENHRQLMAATGAVHPGIDMLAAAVVNALGATPGVDRGSKSDLEHTRNILRALAEIRTDSGQSQAAEVMTLGVLSGLDEPWAHAIVRDFAVRGPSLTLRLSALAQFGNTHSSEEIDRLLAEAVAQDPSLIGDVRYQVAYLAAIENSRHRFPGSEDVARRLYADVLLGRHAIGRLESVRFVLDALTSSPMSGFEPIVRTVASTHPHASIREAAMTALTALQGR